MERHTSSPMMAMKGSPLQRTDSYAELAQLASQLIHEIKNHISTLSINLQLLAEDLSPADTPKERRALQRTLKLQMECQRLADLSNDFLRFAKLRELQLTETDLHGLVDDVVHFYGPSARQANIDIKTFVPPDLPHLLLDRELLKQGMLNLLLNAVQAMPQGGTLTIQANTLPGEDMVELNFIDTGMGMSAEVQERIFEPFFTTRSGGCGLGLPTVKKIVEAHNGQMLVQSEPGRGTKFSIRLPIALPTK